MASKRKRQEELDDNEENMTYFAPPSYFPNDKKLKTSVILKSEENAPDIFNVKNIEDCKVIRRGKKEHRQFYVDWGGI